MKLYYRMLLIDDHMIVNSYDLLIDGRIMHNNEYYTPEYFRMLRIQKKL